MRGVPHHAVSGSSSKAAGVGGIMRWVLLPCLTLPLALFPPSISAQARQDPLEKPSAPRPPIAEPASLKICLRLRDGSRFSDMAVLHVFASQGSPIPGITTESEGEMIFPDLPPGTYMAEASAPGFLNVRQSVETQSGQGLVTLFLIMQPVATSDAAAIPLAFLLTNDPNTNAFFWTLLGAADLQVSEEGLFARPLQPLPIVRPASLRICLRLQDGFPYGGSADVRVVSSQGTEMEGNKLESGSETTFSAIRPGNYLIEASAPGFAPLKRNVEVQSGLKTLFLIMQPQTSSYIFSGLQSYLRPDDPNPKQFSWIGPSATDSMPEVAPDVPCSLPAVLEGAG